MNEASPLKKDPARDTFSFRNIISSSSINERNKQILLQGNIEKVEVSNLEKLWKIHLALPEYVSMQELQELSFFMQAEITDLNRVEILPVYNIALSLTELIGLIWQDLLWFLRDCHPILNGWFDNASVNVKDNIITIAIENSMGLDILKRKNCDLLIAQILKQQFSHEVKIIFTLSEEGSEEGSSWNEVLIAERLAQIQQEVTPAKKEAGGKMNLDYDPILLGKPIKNQSTLIKTILEEEKCVTVQGLIFNYEVREFKTGRKLITFNITDLTDSISVKIFENEKSDLSERGVLKKGLIVKVRGPVQYDKFTQELTLMPYDINKAEMEERMDSAQEKRVELHLHTRMSSMDSIVEVSRLMERLSKWGHRGIAITDHGVVQAFPDAYQGAKNHGLKVVYGVEGYLFDENNSEQSKSYHVLILVKNLMGLKNLYKLITLSHLDYYYRRPRIPRGELVKHREGLIIASACEAGELIQGILKGSEEQQLLQIADFYDYLEVQPIGNNEFLLRNGQCNSDDDLRNINRTVVSLGEKINKPVIATGDVHFLDPDDEVYRRILMAGKGFDDADKQPPLYLKTTQEMLTEFSYLGSEKAKEIVITNPNQVLDSVEEIRPVPSDFYPPKIEGAEEQIIEMTNTKAKAVYGDVLPEVVLKRIKKELDSIINNGFAVLYLIAQKLVKKSNDDGYLVGSRGSVGSSFVATLTGITEVNPLPPHYICPECKTSEFLEDGKYGSGADLPDKDCPTCGTKYKKDGHDIPFEVFLGFKGDKVPDIDLNFSGDYQHKAHKYTEELFGKGYVFKAGTIGTIAEKTAFGFVKNYLGERNISKRGAEINRLTMGCTGVKRTTGQHPGGVMVVPKDFDVHSFTPVQYPADDKKSGVITTHFDYHSIHDNLVKLDILGHDDPTVIKMLEDLTGVDAKTIPLDEAETLKIFSGTEAIGVTPEEIRSNVGTFGIPEFGTKFVRQMLEDTTPKTFSELVRISGFSHGTDVWLNNAQDLIRRGVCHVSEAISARDDIMVYLIYKGLEPSLAFKIMEAVRKGKGVKPEAEEEMKKNKVPAWYIESCKKIKYMFPKAHAVAYVMMAFRIAYFKVYYPEAFYATYFTVRADEFDADIIAQGPEVILRKIEEIEAQGNEVSQKEKNLLTILELAVEMYKRNINMLKVSLADSHSTKFLITPEGILPPFASLQGVGETAARNIMEARDEGPFISIEALRIRARLSKTVIEILDNHGCLQDMTETDQMVLF